MCIEAENYRFTRMFTVTIDGSDYRILVTNRMNSTINGYYGICLENSIFYISRRTNKILALAEIVYGIFYQITEIEHIRQKDFPDRTIRFIEIDGNPRKLADEYCKRRKKSRGSLMDFLYEKRALFLIKNNILKSEIFKGKKIPVILSTKV
jgi:hypothetical protein